MKLSVLMSIYYKEEVAYFNRSMHSIWDDQIIKPDQIILIQDGVLTDDLYNAITFWKNKLSKILVTIVLDENIGLARALNVGLKYCDGNFIARMDTDDISLPDRFKDQMMFLKENPEVDVVGSYISEIDDNDIIIKKVVKFPLTHDGLLKFFKRRDPLAHPSVIFRKSYFKKAGLYSEKHKLCEDTVLWYQGFMSDCRFANIDSVGLMFRRTKLFYKRRADLDKSVLILKTRIFTINRNLKYGLIADFYAVIYFLISISPALVKKILYKLLR